MKKKLIFFVFITSLLLAAGSFLSAAQSDFQGGAFLDSQAGTRPTGLAGAYTAIAADGNASWWNPAALAMLDKKKSMSLTYVPSMLGIGEGNISNFFAAYGQGDTTGYGALGASISYTSVKIGAEFTGDTEYDWSELTALLSWGMQVNQYFGMIKYKYPKVSAGVNLKYLGSNSDLKVDGKTVSASGFSADAALHAAFKENLAVAVVMKDIVSQLTWSSGLAEKVPYSLRVGAYYGITAEFLVSGEIKADETSKGSPEISAYSGAVEYGFLLDRTMQVQKVAVRGGLTVDPNNDCYIIAAGASVEMETFSVDYAYQHYLNVMLDNTHRFGVSMTF